MGSDSMGSMPPMMPDRGRPSDEGSRGRGGVRAGARPADQFESPSETTDGTSEK